MTEQWSVSAITRVLLPIVLVLTVIELGGGLILGSFQATLLQYPSMLVLVPVMIGTAGNLGSILSARLSTSFHLGTLSFDSTDETLLGNTIVIVFLAVSVFPVVGAGAWGVMWVTGDPQLAVGTVVVIALVSGLILAVLAIVVAVSATYAAYRFELDPDDIAIPIVTNICDVLGVIVLFAVVQLLIV
jgi:mgtE-like transporter